MSKQNGDTPKFQLSCPCGQVFSAAMPDGEIMNSLRQSLFIAAHLRPFKCVCGQQFIPFITQVQTAWGAQPISEEQAATLEPNRVLRLT